MSNSLTDTNHIWVVSTVIAIIYLFIRFFEMRFITKENLPLKQIVSDSLKVFVSSVIGLFVIQQITPIIFTSTGGIGTTEDLLKNPPAFTNPVDF